MNRLSEIRKERKLNMSEMAKLLGIPYTTYVGYEKEERHLYADTLKMISGKLGVSIDYIVGRSDEKMPTTPKSGELGEEEYEETYIDSLRILMSLTPEERQKVDAFAQGLIASR